MDRDVAAPDIRPIDVVAVRSIEHDEKAYEFIPSTEFFGFYWAPNENLEHCVVWMWHPSWQRLVLRLSALLLSALEFPTLASSSQLFVELLSSRGHVI